ncbi:MAG: DHA2 family efflux MFS transporter permease subunit [Oscillospiraceae bacterium]|nr:DHA2 family efflux MFS transporter permease subunit [Oscillospiraceae bacterium]
MESISKLNNINGQNELSFSEQKKNMIFGVLLVGCILCSLLQTALTTILPVIMKEFNITASDGQWLTSAYSLAMGIMIPATPFLMKRFPTKKLFMVSMGIFTVGLLLSATAMSFYMLMFGRILQALGCGVLLSLVQVVVLTIYPANKRGAMMGIYGLAVSAIPVIAPSVAGIVADNLGWKIIFFGAVVLAVIDLVAAAFVLKNITEPEKQHFDILSMVLCSAGFSGILISMGNFGTQTFFSLYVALPLVIGIASLVIFAFRQLHAKQPFLELRIFRNREFRLSVIGSMLMYAVMMAGSMLIPVYIQTMRGNSATFSSLVMLPGSLIMAITSLFAGKIYDKIGIRKLFAVGSIGILLSCIGLSFLSDSTSIILIAVLFSVRSFSIACIMMPIVTWGMSTLGSEYTAHGTAILTTLRTIAGSISPAVFLSIMTITGSASPIHGMDTALIGIAGIAAIQCIVALIFVSRKEKKKASKI